MSEPKDSGLRRFWFPVLGSLGYGVTAYSRIEAEALARQAAAKLGRSFEVTGVIEDVDIRELDQQHVAPNMGPPNLRGIWFPRLNL